MKSVLVEAPPFSFLGWRFLIAFLLGTIVLGRQILNFTSGEIIGGAVCGIFLFSGFGFQTFGLITTTASKSAFITSISIILVPVFLIFAKLQKIKLKIWLSMAFAIFGLYLVLTPQGSGITIGDILTFGCAISFAIHVIVQDKYSKQKLNTLRFFLIQALIVSVLSFGNHILFESQTVIWSGRFITAILITAVVATLFGFGMMIQAQKVLSPSRTAIVLSLEPLFAAIIAALLENEVFTISSWIGGLLVISGVMLAETGKESQDY